MRRAGEPWDVEAVNDLKRLFAEGKTFGYIATTLHLSRNSVIGKAHRLGLRYSPEQQAVRRSNPRPRRKRTQAEGASNSHIGRRLTGIAAQHALQRIVDELPTEIRDLPPDQSPFACTLLELTDDTCRWPIGDAPYTFCGDKSFEGASYCCRHARIAYRPAASREPYIGRAA